MKVDKEEAINQLQAFIKVVEAQRVKSISEENADMLIQYATNLINSLWCVSSVSVKNQKNKKQNIAVTITAIKDTVPEVNHRVIFITWTSFWK